MHFVYIPKFIPGIFLYTGYYNKESLNFKKNTCNKNAGKMMDWFLGVSEGKLSFCFSTYVLRCSTEKHPQLVIINDFSLHPQGFLNGESLNANTLAR